MTRALTERKTSRGGILSRGMGLAGSFRCLRGDDGATLVEFALVQCSDVFLTFWSVANVSGSL